MQSRDLGCTRSDGKSLNMAVSVNVYSLASDTSGCVDVLNDSYWCWMA